MLLVTSWTDARRPVICNAGSDKLPTHCTNTTRTFLRRFGLACEPTWLVMTTQRVRQKSSQFFLNELSCRSFSTSTFGAIAGIYVHCRQQQHWWNIVKAASTGTSWKYSSEEPSLGQEERMWRSTRGIRTHLTRRAFVSTDSFERDAQFSALPFVVMYSDAVPVR